ncbi:MAG: hypothetical protein Q4A79_03345 [Candidatus Saccharibacteria bacterium]|nr:hypothetical protein [Candidatus Saccharibacteria bacterium]
MINNKTGSLWAAEEVVRSFRKQFTSFHPSAAFLEEGFRTGLTRQAYTKNMAAAVSALVNWGASPRWAVDFVNQMQIDGPGILTQWHGATAWTPGASEEAI